MKKAHVTMKAKTMFHNFFQVMLVCISISTKKRAKLHLVELLTENANPV